MPTTQELADIAVTPALLLDLVAEAHRAATLAEVAILRLAVEWAHVHPEDPDDRSWQARTPAGGDTRELDPSLGDDATDEDLDWHGVPRVRWDAPAAFAAANHLTTTAGKALIRDALVLRHRLPRVWARTVAGEVAPFRARRVAQAVLAAPSDVVAYVDEHVVGVVDKIGTTSLDRLIDEAMLRLHAEEREIKQLEDLDSQGVWLEENTINHTGIAELYARGDWKDLHDFVQAVGRVASVLKAEGCIESLDVRRAMALGILADPERAQALLDGVPAPAPKSRTVLFLHLSLAAVFGLDPVGRNETAGRAELTETIRAWCGRTDSHLTVRPVLDLADVVRTDAYGVGDRMRDHMALREPTCVFPWCTRPARACDADHITPFAEAEITSSDNIAPLCRHHHRLKTHATWTYRPLDPVVDPGVYLWTDPHGRRYLRGPTGTLEITDTGATAPPTLL